MAKKKKLTAKERRAQGKAQRMVQYQAGNQLNREKQLAENAARGIGKEVRKALRAKPQEKKIKKAPPKVWRREENLPLLALEHKRAADLSAVRFAEPFTLRVKALSPLALGSGQADVNVDADVVHDDVGLPYFPARRLKGLLYESALEITEMAERAGLMFFSREALDTLFQHGCEGERQLVIGDLFLAEASSMRRDWQYLLARYPAFFRVEDVLGDYSSLRYQTRIDRETGTAADTSLRNLRVLDAGLEFSGELCVQEGSREALLILSLAAANLHAAGEKRTRGFGRIACTIEQDGADVMQPLVREILQAKGGEV